jgi:integral membrane sensor domain MASE1
VSREDLLKKLLPQRELYGVGDAVVVVVDSVVVPPIGGAVGLGTVVVVEVRSDTVAVTVACGDAPGAVVVSVLCSQAASSAALARMQIYFFIRYW